MKSNGFISTEGQIQSIIIILTALEIFYVDSIPTIKNGKMIKNYIVVSQKEFKIGEYTIPISNIKKVVVDPKRYWMRIHLKNGKILKFEKSTYSMMLLQFQKCMDTLGIEFGIIRRTGKLWKSKEEIIRIKTTEDYRKMKHEERYKRWVENQKGTNNAQKPPGE